MENYNIITLGASGAGKTVFLASLFKQLSLPADEGVYLTASEDQRIELNKIYTQIAKDESWPVGTIRKITKWHFTCHVRAQDFNEYPVCQFTYLDYGGGIITDKNEEEGEEENLSDFAFNLGDEVHHADAVIVLIDGSHLYKLMKSNIDDGVTKWLYTDLPGTIQLANLVRKQPVHFIITKWDLLQESHDLSKVREHLIERCEEFKRLVVQRVKAGCPVRLIPISSVGYKFVSMQPDGSMKKNLNEKLEPFQLEIPLSYVLVDKVVQHYNNAGKENKARQNLLDSKLNFLLELIPDSFKLGKLLTREERGKRLREIRDTKTALSYLFDIFASHITEFEQNFPAANLGGNIESLNLSLETDDSETDDQDKEVKSFTCSQKQFESLIKSIKTYLDKKGYENQTLSMEDGSILIQIAKRGRIRQFVGMSQALDVHFTHRTQSLKLKFSGGKWLDKAGFATAGALFFTPLVVTAGLGAWQQSRLPKMIEEYISNELK